MGVLKESLPVYQERKAQNLLWPGQIENVRDYCTHSCCDINPDFIHVFDPAVLHFHFTQAGFKVEKTDYYPTKHGDDTDFKNDGRECVGIIASKP